MNATDLLAALGLPASARVDQRVPKTLLVEHGAPTAADKSQINEGIEEFQWVAALKPTTIGVAEYRDDEREYLEIAVLCLTLRTRAKAGRLTELVHRAVPYPVLLVTAQGLSLTLSLAHKRWSQGEAGKTVLDGEINELRLDGISEASIVRSLLDALSLTRQPRTTLHALYQGWTDTVLAGQAARVTGAFASPTSAEHAAARREALTLCSQFETRMVRLRAAAAKEKQLPRKVEFNLELKRLQADYAAARARL